jgi:hypothetical protein
VKKLDAEGLIKQNKKHNAEVKILCVMQNKWIDGLTTNHSLAPLPKQKRMRALNVEEME